MTRNHRLFTLVKSLTKAEKRYFRLYATMTKKYSNYLRLFDTIDKQADYDEKAIKARFVGESFVKQLHVTKNYLYQLILKSLRSYHSRASIETELKELLLEVEILYRKELLEHCDAILAKVERIARQYEKHITLLDVLAWKRKLLLARNAAYEVTRDINAVLEQEQHSLTKIDTLCRYWSHTINLFQHNSGTCETFKNDPLLNQIELADTLQAKILYYHIDYSDAIFQSDVKRAELAVSDLIALLEQHPDRIQEDPGSYITAINNKIGLLLHTKQFAAISPLLEKIRAVPVQYKIDEKNPMTVKHLLRTYNIELEMCRDTGRADAGIASIDIITDLLDKYKTSVPREYDLLFYYQFSYLYFMNDDFKHSLYWLNALAKQNFATIREDIQSFARLLTLIVHFELGHIGVLKYSVDSTRRFLKKKRDLQQYESILLNFFSRLSLAHPNQYPQLFKTLHNDLFTRTGSQMTDSVLDFLDFKSWIEHHLRER